MKRRRLVRLALLSALVVLLVALLFPVNRWRLSGLLHGERFYHGKPTSYWRAALNDGWLQHPAADSFARRVISLVPWAIAYDDVKHWAIAAYTEPDPYTALAEDPLRSMPMLLAFLE